MKTFKCFVISSDGSSYFSRVSSDQLIFFQKQDDKNFILNQKKEQIAKNSNKISAHYKKKYFK